MTKLGVGNHMYTTTHVHYRKAALTVTVQTGLGTYLRRPRGQKTRLGTYLRRQRGQKTRLGLATYLQVFAPFRSLSEPSLSDDGVCGYGNFFSFFFSGLFFGTVETLANTLCACHGTSVLSSCVKLLTLSWSALVCSAKLFGRACAKERSLGRFGGRY